MQWQNERQLNRVSKYQGKNYWQKLSNYQQENVSLFFVGKSGT